MTEQPRLHHLLDRMRHGVLLPAEAERLAGLVTGLEQQLADAVHRAEQAERLAQTRAARIDAITTDRATLRLRLAGQETETMRLDAHVTELAAEVARLTAGQCTDSRRMCDLHHTRPVDGCPYPKCKTARTATA